MDFLCQIFHTMLIYFISSFGQDLSCKYQSMKRELLKDEWSPPQIATKCFLEGLNFLHSINKFCAQFSCNLLSYLIRFEDFICNLLYRHFHAFCQQLSFILYQILWLYLSFFDKVSVVIHMSFDEPMQLSSLNHISSFNILRFAFKNLVEEEIF